MRERHDDVTLTVEVHLKGFVTFLLQVARIKKRNKVTVKGKKAIYCVPPAFVHLDPHNTAGLGSFVDP